MSSAHLTFSPFIPQLPKGAKISKIGMGSVGAFEFYGDKIVKAIPRSPVQVLVVPDQGYEFVFQIETNSYFPILSASTRTVTFDVSNPEHAAFVDQLSEHPAFLATTQSGPAPLAKALAGSQIEVVKPT